MAVDWGRTCCGVGLGWLYHRMCGTAALTVGLDVVERVHEPCVQSCCASWLERPWGGAVAIHMSVCSRTPLALCCCFSTDLDCVKGSSNSSSSLLLWPGRTLGCCGVCIVKQAAAGLSVFCAPRVICVLVIIHPSLVLCLFSLRSPFSRIDACCSCVWLCFVQRLLAYGTKLSVHICV